MSFADDLNSIAKTPEQVALEEKQKDIPQVKSGPKRLFCAR